jgi:hypothetical protein
MLLCVEALISYSLRQSQAWSRLHVIAIVRGYKMNTAQIWTEKDFDDLSWHDCYFYSFALRDPGEYNTSQIVFELDYILEWLQPTADKFSFLVAPAILTFYEVSELKVTLNYSGMAMGPFSIDGIERELKTYPSGYQSYHWRIPVNYPGGEISFNAEGFSQELLAAAIESGEQCLSWKKRSTMFAV